ncbi:MAG TPA: family 78 glycoside hydrolase catalytic domain [Dysgonamonadaceae bacterium]|nr:family 78 glycoside hydrolase catalytic domain [Dysgonamonadaceae bacterium]
MISSILRNKYFRIGRFSLILIFTFHFSCTHTNTKKEKYSLDENGLAIWIGDGKLQPDIDSLFYLDDPAPLFRKEFNLKSELKTAHLLITAAGYYTARINSDRVGINMLDPAWTAFDKRIYYSEYDITDLLNPGENCLGITLGNGFYNPLPLRMWGNRNLREVVNTGRPVFIAKIILEYENGTKEEIVTDNTWKFSYGGLMKNNLFLGEVYDSRKEISDWDLCGFDDSSWSNAVYSKGPGGKLQKAFFKPIQVTKRITPINIYEPQKGIYIVDMGVNFAGTYRIKLNGEPGDSVLFRFGERIYPDGTLNPMTTVAGQVKHEGMGGPGAPDIAWQTDTYIFDNNTEVCYQPEFTFHTYRYMEISGLNSKPEIEDVEGLALNSNVSGDNSFSCSSDLINSIQEATRSTFLSNLIGVQSDCPAREKFGYGGDLNATSEAFIYNFDMQMFYRKTVYDWVDAMNDSIFVDTAPYVGIKSCGLSWESAFLTTQYYLYLYYKDVEFVKEMYELNKEWMKKAARLHPTGLVDFGLGDHESLVPVPVELTGTSHYLLCANIMQKFASIMKDAEGEKQYKQLAEKIKTSLKSEFWDKPLTGEINRQTLFASLLYYDVVPSEQIDIAVDSLLTSLKNAPSGHFITGIFGTKYMLEVLSKYVSPGKVYEIVNSREYPGWGFMIDNGATTLWETWKESDNTYSNCHPMLGSVTEWFYRWLGGIQLDANYPGFEKFVLTPFVPDDLDQVSCIYNSPYGKIVSNWEKKMEKIVYHIEIPSGTSAFVKLNKNISQEIQLKKESDPAFKADGITGLQDGIFELEAGEYIITVL